MPELSVLVPGIRVAKWAKLVESIGNATKRSFEVIFVGPFEPETHMPNTVFVKDYGNPTRCQQIALEKAVGKWVTWGADDGVFLPGSLDKAIDILESTQGIKNVIQGRYTESNSPDPSMYNDEYYHINYHDGARSDYIPNDYVFINVGVLSREYCISLGGWDSEFEVPTTAHMDLSIRMQRDGANIIKLPDIMFSCSHFPTTSGDHAPIHYAHIEHDLPLYYSLHRQPISIKRIKIAIDNWKKVPEVWERRFDETFWRNNPVLSILMPGIRPQNWQTVYDSIERSINGRYSWELVAIGPEKGEVSGNFSYIEDWGSPSHCLQRSLFNCRGRYVFCCATDDSLFLPNALDRSLDDADAIFCKHVQGSPDLNDPRWQQEGYKEIVPFCIGAVALNPDMLTDAFHTIGYHKHNHSCIQYLPKEWLTCGGGIIKKSILLEVGGFDTESFETIATAIFELGIRLQRGGYKCILWPHVVLAANYEVVPQDQRGPVDLAYIDETTTYNKIYSDKSCLDRVKVPVRSEDYNTGKKWKRRYK
jgi:hypothetical protein